MIAEVVLEVGDRVDFHTRASRIHMFSVAVAITVDPVLASLHRKQSVLHLPQAQNTDNCAIFRRFVVRKVW